MKGSSFPAGNFETQIVQPAGELEYRLAMAALRSGNLVAFPTETVYGLGADAYNPAAIAELFRVKGRESAKAIAVLVGEMQALEGVVGGTSRTAERLALKFFPGPLTLVVPRHPSLPEILSPLPTIGVRIPDHPVALELLKRSGPLAVSSANLSGRQNTTCAAEAFEQLGGRISLIIDGGKTPGGMPSTVVDCTGEQLLILRSGPISLEQLQAALDT